MERSIFCCLTHYTRNTAAWHGSEMSQLWTELVIASAAITTYRSTREALLTSRKTATVQVWVFENNRGEQNTSYTDSLKLKCGRFSLQLQIWETRNNLEIIICVCRVAIGVDVQDRSSWSLCPCFSSLWIFANLQKLKRVHIKRQGLLIWSYLTAWSQNFYSGSILASWLHLCKIETDSLPVLLIKRSSAYQICIHDL